MGKKVSHVACGGFHSAAILDTGELYTWGGGEHGQVRKVVHVCAFGICFAICVTISQVKHGV